MADIVPNFFLFLLFNFFIIVDLQCSVKFCCTAKWPHSYIYMYILFLTLSSIMFHLKWSDVVPCAIQQDLIAYPLQMQYFSSTKPQIPVHPIPFPSPLANTSLISFFFFLDLHLWPTPCSQPCKILNVLSRARDWIHILIDTSQVSNPLNHNGNSPYF